MAMLRCMNCMEEYNEKNNKCPHCGFAIGQTTKEPGLLPQETVLQRRYVVGCKLKQTDNDILYIGWDQILEKKIAVREYFPKSLGKRSTERKELCWETEEEKAAFMRGMEQFGIEARQLAKFREDTGIVRIYDSFQENGTAYMITEYAESMREQEKKAPPEKGSTWQKKKKWYHAGLGIGITAIFVIAMLLVMEMNPGLEMSHDTFAYERIPDMTGMTYKQAEKTMEGMGIKIQRERYCGAENMPEDIILCQNVLSGSKAEQGMVVKVVVTKKGEPATTETVSKNTESTIEATTEAATRETTGKKRTQEKTTNIAAPVTTETVVTEQSTEVAATVEPTTEQRKTTEQKTEKTTEKRTTQEKTERVTEQEKTTEKITTEEVIVIEE